MSNLFIAPLIAADDGNAEDFDRWRLQQHEQSLHVAAARTGTIFIDDDLTAGGSPRKDSGSC